MLLQSEVATSTLGGTGISEFAIMTTISNTFPFREIGKASHFSPQPVSIYYQARACWNASLSVIITTSKLDKST